MLVGKPIQCQSGHVRTPHDNEERGGLFASCACAMRTQEKVFHPVAKNVVNDSGSNKLCLEKFLACGQLETETVGPQWKRRLLIGKTLR